MSALGWVLVAAAATAVYLPATRWCMPTPKAKRKISFAPFGGLVFLVPSAMVKGYSVSQTLCIYSGVLLLMVVLLVPIRKRVLAATLEQELNPLTKVEIDTVSWWWMGLSIVGGIAAFLYIWPTVA